MYDLSSGCGGFQSFSGIDRTAHRGSPGGASAGKSARTPRSASRAATTDDDGASISSRAARLGQGQGRCWLVVFVVAGATAKTVSLIPSS